MAEINTPVAPVDMDLQLPATASNPEPPIIWRNRTKISWGCFVLNVAVFMSIFFLPVDKINASKEVMTNLLYANVLVIAAYFGTTALPFLSTRK
jgi:hypothetical protein